MGKPLALELPSSSLFPSGSGRKRHEETTADVISISLPEDIIFFDVLARLPVKTLCRYLCVSKRWCALLSGPVFASAQRSRAAAPLVVGVFGEPRPLEKFYPPRPPRFPQPSLELRVIDTADGSVLRVVKDVKSAKLTRTRLDLVFVDKGLRGASVIDPATGRVVTVGGGEASMEYPKADCNGTPYCFMHTEYCHSNFGRAAPSGAYKVLRLRNAVTELGDVQICQIATIGAAEPSSWRQRPEPPIPTCWCSSCTATVNGVLHFMDRGAPAHGGHSKNSAGWNHIASFDLESEEWKAMIDGPPIGCPNKEERWEMALAELKNTLSVIQTVWSPSHLGDSYTKIWLLVDREKSTWKMECMIQMMPKNWCFLKVLDIFVDGRVLMLNAFDNGGKDLHDFRCILQLYDPSTRALTDLMKMGKDFRGPMTLYTGDHLLS